ncbi:hypothetical protein SEA_BRUSACORAM_37 [Mycobacterium phage Brusacoram]|uniref:Uncharacterized protein n=4 Tax=Caudoviricetes TaxID=2731619 RepID=A0A0K1Y6N5_9CAUD|nr:hypothetical protein SEA_BRUSACORAM_37 [Mycobacterium phage Brusacoram]YP_009302353.1 hypothetical protein BJD69_gp39 [Mycobacterium phage Xeno]YP_009964370.1 hypothetical protein I5J40_gp37 [Mycobacterium phage Atcoo]ATW59166.1 hypothetical protein SEA_THESPIS_37 [Mycobacterium phage Thespis]AKY02563.1 hypothetical protein SEA_BRUSACORAM_37 [Mycobacterium phage Brusacoram]AMS02123.1 hypothetical protein SEA_XENO_39 [Mycobacterium phage Xeno]QGJ88615.1 hypothetical protein SEA_ATCOO_37 [My
MMTLVDRFNSSMNEAIHVVLAEVGALVDAFLEPISRKATANALGRNGFSYDYAANAAAAALAEAEAETEVSEPDPYRLPITIREYVPAAEVRLDDLAARILAVPCNHDLSHTLALNIAGSLLDEFRIAKK